MTSSPLDNLEIGGLVIKKVFAAIALVIAVFLVYVAFKSPHFKIERSIVINAAPSAPFELVNDFHRWQTWSPWAELDPAAKNSFSGAAAGAGAVFEWAGNDKVGEGKMTIVDSQVPTLIRIKLEFFKPWPGESDTAFSFASEGTGTKVTWTMNGTNNFVSRLMCMFMDMDKMVGGDFEKGLAKMKAQAESTTIAPAQ